MRVEKSLYHPARYVVEYNNGKSDLITMYFKTKDSALIYEKLLEISNLLKENDNKTKD